MNCKESCSPVRNYRLILLIFLLGFVSQLYGSSVKIRDSLINMPLFKDDYLLKIELTTNLSELINDIADKRSYHDSRLKIFDQQGEVTELDVKVKTRGNFRRRKQNCNFPPLRFKINSDKAHETVFKGQSKLKYVSHCQSYIENYEQHTIEEYLIYRMYNLVSDHSYRVRLAQITFIDNNSDEKLNKYGFFLEDRDDVAQRNGKSNMNYKNVKQYNILRNNMVMLSLFQLMIGNSDWDVERLHNVNVMSVSDHSLPVVVPFDFDWSGIINHPYYTLSPKIAPDAKYKRLYKGMRWSTEELEKAFSNFQKLKPDFLDLITSCKYLKTENKNKFIAYIEEFYQLIGSRRDVRMMIEKNAPKIPISR